MVLISDKFNNVIFDQMAYVTVKKHRVRLTPISITFRLQKAM